MCPFQPEGKETREGSCVDTAVGFRARHPLPGSVGQPRPRTSPVSGLTQPRATVTSTALSGEVGRGS